MKILIVDDHNTSRELFPRFMPLVMPGIEFVLAKNFEEGKELLRTHPDIEYIITDYQMGDDSKLATSVNCLSFLKDASKIKKHLNGAEAKPLIGATVHTAMVLMYPNEDEYGAHEILRNTHALRHLQLPVMDLEKYGDWTNKCNLLKAHIEECQQNVPQEKERNAGGR